MTERGLGNRTPDVATAEQLLGACSASDAAAVGDVVEDVHCTGCGTASVVRLLVRPGVAKASLRLVAGLLRSTSDHCDERAAHDLPCECMMVVSVADPLSVDLQHDNW